MTSQEKELSNAVEVLSDAVGAYLNRELSTTALRLAHERYVALMCGCAGCRRKLES